MWQAHLSGRLAARSFNEHADGPAFFDYRFDGFESSFFRMFAVYRYSGQRGYDPCENGNRKELLLSDVAHGTTAGYYEQRRVAQRDMVADEHQRFVRYVFSAFCAQPVEEVIVRTDDPTPGQQLNDSAAERKLLGVCNDH